ncbi:condensin subunit YCS4 [Spizellomyces punctatus DAOM BR117]|uniref:Condensin complex subunit 1 n=1 Tax=Spizellomyces punctatus (strain DAOM BR117) TaxID=645134 RepID=A0A0L0H9H9_SPIPD|nr:condensin subunit YCS4 [Spizellomyces punctatus DAOM BR117]KNC98205.1 hypothetical protein SPPG_06606 [Spizellomyces punctatus DAOM BR117]|eukprot:XP_016606245.1 hypothetical protein SPPG_06606 [Spizellomyces punctatus DAOM BR117]
MSDLFNLHEELVHLQENNVQIDNELDITNLSPDSVSEKLDELVEALQGDPTHIIVPETFDTTRSFIRHFDALSLETTHKFVDLLLSVFADQMRSVETDIEENAQHNFEQDKSTLLMYTFCWHWLLEMAENRWKSIKKQNDKAATLTGKPKGRTAKGKREDAGGWDWGSQKLHALQNAMKLLDLDLNRIIIALSDRESLINMINKSVSLILEDPEAVKEDAMKSCCIDILALCVTRYDRGMGQGLQTRVVDQYLREEHLADFVADWMHTLVVKYSDTTLIESVLRRCMNKEFSDKDLKVAKAFSKFLVRLSELAPKEVLKQMVHLQVHFDSESYTIRLGMIEVIGNLIHNLLALDSSESAAKSLHAYYEILQERFRDVNAYVRVKVLQVLIKLTERREDSGLTDIPLATRPLLINLTAGRLQDKASNVRKNAIKLLTKFISTSPFFVIAQDEGRLSLKWFEEKKHNLEEVIKLKFPKEELPGVADDEEKPEDGDEKTGSSEDGVPDEEDVDRSQKEDVPGDGANDEPSVEETASSTLIPGEQELRNLRGLLKYYRDGIRFIRQIEAVVPTMCELLASNTKGEVIEAMNFFVTAHRYEMECATMGVRKMVHKVWDKDTGESERLSVRDHLIKSYFALYFEPPPSRRDPAEAIADNLITLTHTMTLAELTSLEQLLSLMVASNMVDESVLPVLWGVFASKKQAAQRRRGAIIILGMLGKAKKEVIAENLEILLRVGLGEFAKRDLLLARYSCVALQQLGTVRRQKGSLSPGYTRLPANHPIFMRLRDLMIEPAGSLEWFGFAEQAINAIYLLSEHPDITCGDVVKNIASSVLNLPKSVDSDVDQVAAQLSETLHIDDKGEDAAMESQKDDALIDSCDPLDLSKLCFVVGHVAIKQIVHLEAVEAEWKRRKHAEEAIKTPRKQGGDELDQVTGTAEDEFTEAIAHIRERELLFGDRSLLGSFGPLIAYICLHNAAFNHPILQIMAVLALCKFMCVSSDFCDAHLQLLFTILEKAEDPIIRSNTVIGLGDMTVCFNSLIDQNISYLYNRLNDKDLNVKKNTLMVLTFLILNGMVKVKGQISEMAKCLQDEDQRISDLAKLFFTELSTKDNAVYNNLPDIISNLSHPETGVAEDTFKDIMKFLLDFIKKDKQTENIVEKLCLRFRNADGPRQWRDISFCLSLLSFASDKSVKKLVEHLPHFQDKLHEPVLYKHFQDILGKAKKVAKPETKTLIEDFEVKLQELHEKCVENEQAVSAASQEQQKANKGGKVKREPDMDGVSDALDALSLEANAPNRKRRQNNAAIDDDVDINDLFDA